jgi:hypothetical protein
LCVEEVEVGLESDVNQPLAFGIVCVAPRLEKLVAAP